MGLVKQADQGTLKNFRNNAVARAEKRYLTTLMARTGWDVTAACRISGLKRARLYQLLKAYDIAK